MENLKVIGHGRESADIVFVDGFASKEDMRTGSALSESKERFIGAEIRNASHTLGLSYYPNEFYYTIYIKDELEYMGNNKKKFYEAVNKAKEAAKPFDYDELLKNEILEANPNVIVPLDNLSLKVISGVAGIRNYRGSVIPLRADWQVLIPHPVRVIPTLSPYFAFHEYAVRPTISFDFLKILKFRHRQDPFPEFNVWVCKTLDAFRNFVNRFPNPEFVTTDIETYCGLPTCISFCFDGKEAISVPLLDKDIDSANAVLLWYDISKLLASRKFRFVNQNIKYDWHILERFGFRIRNIVGDTNLAAGLIYPELDKDLGFLTSIYTEMPYYKSEGKEYDPKLHDKSKLYLYNGKDALSTWQVHKAQEEELEETGQTELYKERIIPLLHLYKEIEDNGIRVDDLQRQKLEAKYSTLYNVYQQELHYVTGNNEINPLSWQQAAELIYVDCKFPARRKLNEAGVLTWNTEEEVLTELMVLHGEDNRYGLAGKRMIQLVVACRKFNKLLSYIRSIVHPNGRMYTSYNLAGTSTGRTSAGKLLDIMLLVNEKGKIFKSGKMGINVQNQPKHGFLIDGVRHGIDFRSMFVPSRGYEFVEGDQSQAEARAVAVLSEDYEFLKQFDIAPGIHKLTASWLFGVDPFSIEKSSEEYHLGKIVRHAGNNNMKSQRLALMSLLTLRECDELLERFHNQSPQIRSVFHADIRSEVKTRGVLRTPFGRRRDFFGKYDENTFNEAIGYIQQSTISDQTKFAMLRIRDRVDMRKTRLLAEIHDSVLAEVKKGYVEEYGCILKEELEKPIDFNNCSLSRDFQLVIPAELERSETNWHDLQKM